MHPVCNPHSITRKSIYRFVHIAFTYSKQTDETWNAPVIGPESVNIWIMNEYENGLPLSCPNSKLPCLRLWWGYSSSLVTKAEKPCFYQFFIPFRGNFSTFQVRPYRGHLEGFRKIISKVKKQNWICFWKKSFGRINRHLRKKKSVKRFGTQCPD